ncbi:MAG: FAD-dependent oxidoreductase [Rhodobacteraceae bacterium]|nr:FAD-dependent oxidoreductase [Paracoccaceae bacterium]
MIGGGAAGLSAAIAARAAGASVVVLDERKVAGGQYFKQPAGPRSLVRWKSGGPSTPRRPAPGGCCSWANGRGPRWWPGRGP